MERDFWPRFHLVRILWKVQLEEMFLDALRTNSFPKRAIDVEILLGHVPHDYDDYPEEIRSIERKKAIRSWFREGGSCPLVREWSWDWR